MLMSSPLYSSGDTVRDIEHYAITLIQIVTPFGKTLPKKLGSDLADARKRRRISTTTMSQRAMISRTTLVKVERGDQGVSMGIYATVLFVLGMTERIADLADAARDRTGLDHESENLPKRISSSRKKRDGTANRSIHRS